MRGTMIVAAFLAALFLSRVTVAAAAGELGGTVWYSTNDTCPIDELDFNADGTVDAYDDMNEDEDTGTWSLDGDNLTIEYKNWYGGQHGTVGDKTIETTETWKSEKTGEVKENPCIFGRDDD